MDKAFARNYEAEFLREQPGLPTELRHYPRGGKAFQEGHLVRVKPRHGDPWVGVFAFGHTGGFDELSTTPNPDWLCVVARNQAYLVDTRQPDCWEHVNKGTPITQVMPAKEAGLLLFADHTEIEAWDATGLAWRSARLSLDGLRHLHVEGQLLHGEGWYPDNWEAFTLDLGTGQHEGGHDQSLLDPGRPPGLWWRVLWKLRGIAR